MREIQVGDWVIWVDSYTQWNGRKFRVEHINNGFLHFEPTGEDCPEGGWLPYRVRLDESYEVEQLLKEYGV